VPTSAHTVLPSVTGEGDVLLPRPFASAPAAMFCFHASLPVFVMSPDPEDKQWLIGRGIARPASSRGSRTSPPARSRKAAATVRRLRPSPTAKPCGRSSAPGSSRRLNFSGREIWKRDLAKDYGKFNINWVYGSSPLLFGGKTLRARAAAHARGRRLPWHHRCRQGDRESYLLALDPASGKTLWKHVRPTDAEQESQETYATPIPAHRRRQGAASHLRRRLPHGHDD